MEGAKIPGRPTISLLWPHPPENVIMLYKMMPQTRKGVDTREREQGVGQIAVYIFRGMKHRSIGVHSGIQSEHPEIEYTTVPNKSHSTDERNDEHQAVKHQVDRGREPASAHVKYAMVRASRDGVASPRNFPSRCQVTRQLFQTPTPIALH
jgi:hypothetical protein